MKKRVVVLTVAAMCAALCGCGNAKQETKAAGSAAATSSPETTVTAAATDSKLGTIDVVSREDGSGTRGAFIELFGIEEKTADGKKVDNTTEDAEITNSTSVMMTTVLENINAIGYISLGSLDDSVRAIAIDGAEANVGNIKSGEYKIARPFNIAVTDNLSDTAKDFIKFIMSEEGQKVVEDNGYISQGNEGKYENTGVTGKVSVAGSSSVTPVMEKLQEAYEKENPDVTIEVQQSDSTTGMTSAIDGVCDIGMASRALKDSEIEKGLKSTVIAMDGIAVIVNNNSPVTGLTSDNIKSIFTGEITEWSDVQ